MFCSFMPLSDIFEGIDQARQAVVVWLYDFLVNIGVYNSGKDREAFKLFL